MAFGLDDVLSFVGPVLNYIGARDRNETQKEQNFLQMQFQEYMSSTAYQRAVKDLEAAGLNPMLALMKGGAATGAGSAAQIENEATDAVNSMNSGMQARAMVRRAEAETELLKAQKDKTVAETSESEARTASAQADLPLKSSQVAQNQSSAAAHHSQVELNVATMKNLAASFYHIINQTQVSLQEIELIRQRWQNAIEERNLTIAKTGIAKVDEVLRKLEVPLAQNLARAEGTWWKREVSPFMPDLGTGARTFRNFRGFGR